MPIITDETDLNVAEGRTIRLAGMPDFNAGDAAFKITAFDGWFDAAVPDVVLVANGGGAGAVASGEWLLKEAYYTLTGHMDVGRAEQATMRRALLAAFPTGQDGVLICLGNGLDEDLQIFVRRYDAPQVNLNRLLSFSLPLVGVDPYKYGLLPLTGSMGVFTGETWFRTYGFNGTNWVRTYAASGSNWVRNYQQLLPTGPFPPSLTLESNGDAVSQRVTFSVTGPLTAGEWWLLHEGTGQRLWAELSITADQTLVFDSHARTARLNGAVADHFVFGSWVGLHPGQNTFRLVAGTQSEAFATVSALPAYL